MRVVARPLVGAGPLTARKILALKIGEALSGLVAGLNLNFTQNTYRTESGTYSQLTDAVTYTGGLSTMADSDGVLKWAPHNLALNSAAPATQNITVVSGADYTVECTGVSVALSGAGTGAVAEGSPVEVTASTTTLTLTVTGSVGTIWCYRSDLGGMVNNPATGNSYVPTTSAAVYLPRVGHHEFDGTHSGDGTELIDNGGFDTDSDWTLDGAWAISDGQAVNPGATSFDVIEQSLGADYQGTQLLVTFTVVSATGTVAVRLGNITGASQITAVTEAGTYSVVASPIGVGPLGQSWLRFVCNSGAGQQVTLDNVSTQVALPNYVNEGLLLESEARTNLITYSEDFTDASWGKTNTGALAIDAIGPDGETSAVTLVDNGLDTTSTALVYVQNDFTVSTSTGCTFSIFAKADQLSWVAINIRGNTTINDSTLWFDLSSGVLGTSTGTAVDGTAIESMGNGWFRCSVTFTSDATDTTGQVRIYLADGDGDALVPDDGTSSILIYGAQFEEASTPSSYIPTQGATETRTAQTVTVPAANVPWPEAQVIGSEEVSNGDFSDGATGWTDDSTGTGTATVSGGALQLTTDDTSNRGSFSQEVPLTVGKVYLLDADITGANASGGQVRFDGTIYSVGTLPAVLVYGNTDATLQLTTNAGAATDLQIDNVTIREMNPLAVTIAMDGAITYADTDNALEARFVNWQLDTSNRIYWDFRTSGSRVGQPTFNQRESNVLDTIEGGLDDYSPGINVAFSLASRHGSNFINGAVDGVALTENTTPTALPDLSSTDLSISPTFMGSISQFRVWDVDLGDDGIASETS